MQSNVDRKRDGDSKRERERESHNGVRKMADDSKAYFGRSWKP